MDRWEEVIQRSGRDGQNGNRGLSISLHRQGDREMEQNVKMETGRGRQRDEG